MDEIKNLIAAYVRDNNTTRAAVAAQLGITSVSLWNKLNGKTRFYLDEAVKLANILDCDLNLFRNC